MGSTPEGTLYQGEYPDSAKVAILVLPGAGRKESASRERFSRATRIQHPNVASIHEIGTTEDGWVYVVLEQVLGEPLSNLLSAGHAFTLGEAVDVVLQTAGGLRAAHREGLVHGHLSAHGILVTRERFGGLRVKLGGFTLDSDFRGHGARRPNPEGASAAYASPERLAGHPPDERSEVFSLGAVLHHLLSGKPPEPGQVDQSVPRAARAVLETALAPAPDRRFQTILELDEALRALAELAANPRRTTVRLRRRVGAMAAGLLLAAGAVWLVAGSNSSRARPEPAAPLADSVRTAVAPPVRARSPAQGAPAEQRSAGRVRKSPADSGRSPPAARPAAAPRVTRQRSTRTALTGAQGNTLSDSGRTPPARELVREPSAGPPVVPESEARPPGNSTADNDSAYAADESRETPEVLGYRSEAEPLPVPGPPRDSAPVPEGPLAKVAPPVRTTDDPRPRAELERDQGLRQAIGDVIRLGIATDVAENRPGFLVVLLTPDGMQVPSVLYNLQRLYLAYSAATEYRDEVALELRQGTDLYGWFTRAGLRFPP